MQPVRPQIAFYAPMKSPDHPTPSGDRQIARLTLTALGLAGFEARTVSDLRTLDKTGDTAEQARLSGAAQAEAARLLAELAPDPPRLWYTYHCHHKAPDLLGPMVSAALKIPYVISEPSISPRRRTGPWADFAALSERAIAAADRLFWTTARDRPALEAAGHASRMVHLPAFVDPGPPPPTRPQTGGTPLALLSVAMMRDGDKLESYRRLAAMLAHLPGTWRLDVIGDGPVRAEVEALLDPFADRVTFHGAIQDADRLRAAYEAADLLVWPGVGEGVGMVYLEAQAAGCPVLAEDHPAQRDLVAGPLAPPDNAAAGAALAMRIVNDPEAHAHARAHVARHHSLGAAAHVLDTSLRKLLA